MLMLSSQIIEKHIVFFNSKQHDVETLTINNDTVNTPSLFTNLPCPESTEFPEQIQT